MKTQIIFLLFLVASCQRLKPIAEKKVIDFGAFSIEVPKSWTKINQRGIDSYVGGIAISLEDTIEFDLGSWSNSLKEDEPFIMSRSSLENFKDLDTSQIVLVDDVRHVDPDKFKNQSLTWDTIDGLEAKIIFPRRAGKGITGIYIDSLWTTKLGVDRFNLYGTDLSPENQAEFLEAIKTLKFKLAK